MIARGFTRLSDVLGDRDWLVGEFSIADLALFYISYWAGSFDIQRPPTSRASAIE